jgi:hypothetical protein
VIVTTNKLIKVGAGTGHKGVGGSASFSEFSYSIWRGIMIFFFYRVLSKSKKALYLIWCCLSFIKIQLLVPEKKNQDLWPPLLCVSKLELFCGEVSKICAKKI